MQPNRNKPTSPMQNPQELFQILHHQPDQKQPTTKDKLQYITEKKICKAVLHFQIICLTFLICLFDYESTMSGWV